MSVASLPLRRALSPEVMPHGMVWLLVGALYAPIFNELYRHRWATVDYTHAYLVLPVSLWLVWRDRLRLAALPRPDQRRILADYSGLAAVAAGLALFIFGWRQEFMSVATLSLLALVWGITRYLYGAAVARGVRFPVLYLLFLVPPPLGVLDSVTIPLRYGISQATEFVLRAGGYPIIRSGLMLTIADHDIFMGAPCSGFRSLVTLLALAVIYVYISKNSSGKKIFLIFTSFPLALLGNFARVISLCLVTFYLGPQFAEGTYHDLSGAIMFLIMIGGLMAIEQILNTTRLSRKES